MAETPQTLQQWLDRQSEIPDGNGYDALERPRWAREEFPELYDALMRYIERREAFNETADLVGTLMESRGWEAM